MTGQTTLCSTSMAGGFAERRRTTAGPEIGVAWPRKSVKGQHEEAQGARRREPRDSSMKRRQMPDGRQERSQNTDGAAHEGREKREERPTTAPWGRQTGESAARPAGIPMTGSAPLSWIAVRALRATRALRSTCPAVFPAGRLAFGASSCCPFALRASGTLRLHELRPGSLPMHVVSREIRERSQRKLNHAKYEPASARPSATEPRSDAGDQCAR